MIEKIKRQRNYLPSEFGIGRIGLFGSVGAGTGNDRNDIDLVLKFRRPLGLRFIRLVECLEKTLVRKVDIVMRDSLENIRVKKLQKTYGRP